MHQPHHNRDDGAASGNRGRSDRGSEVTRSALRQPLETPRAVHSRGVRVSTRVSAPPALHPAARNREVAVSRQAPTCHHPRHGLVGRMAH